MIWISSIISISTSYFDSISQNNFASLDQLIFVTHFRISSKCLLAMEHLRAPPDTPEIVIPYLEGDLFENYSTDGANSSRATNYTAIFTFKTYFMSRGWNLDAVGKIQPTLLTAKELITRVQSSLYFGCLISVFRCIGIGVQTQYFLKDDGNGNKTVSTRNLLNLLAMWRMQEESFVFDGAPFPDVNNPKTQRCYNILEMLAWTHSFSKELFEEARKKPDAPSCPLAAVELSLMALGESLSLAAHKIYGRIAERAFVWGPSCILAERLQRSGWCISDLPFFPEAESATSICADYYFGSHPCPRSRPNHASCTKVICAAYQEIVDPETYNPIHTATCLRDNCRKITAPPEVVDVVNADGVPAISWDGRVIKASAYAPGVKYVAISHVWSDGLGNDDQTNWMHSCQLSRIQRLVDNLYGGTGNVGFWMDTLCIPVGPRHVQTRKKAIRQMANTYRKSDKVLVLDSSIMSLSRTASISEKYIAIHLSNWHHRLWTLQEGQLGRSLYFQFKEGAQSFAEMRAHMPDIDIMEMDLLNVVSPIDRYAATELERFYRHFENLASTPGVDISQRMITCARYLRNRETSRKEDETLCVSTILGFDPRNLLKVSGLEGRMVEFYNMIQRFDRRIIFNRHERLQKHGYRWAPRSLLQGAQDLIVSPEDVDGRQLPVTISANGGLLLRYSGMVLDYNGLATSNNSITFTADPSTVHPISLKKFGSAPSNKVNEWVSRTPPGPWWFRHFKIEMLPNDQMREPVWESGTRYAIITWADVLHNQASVPGVVGIVESLEDGDFPVEAQVGRDIENSIQYDEAGMWRPTHSIPQVIVIHHLCNATVTMLPSFGWQRERLSHFSNWFSFAPKPVPPAGSDIVVQGTVYSAAQKWCVR
ncbi:hypothetical protein ABW19_dt0209232 [Dactylella cylindrospora]|nr:hypothetical protein ABW19_dt0209232 [Dactylella cylindrospora]